MESQSEIDILNLINSYNESCPICFENLSENKKIVKLECKHSYCYTCFIEMYTYSLQKIKREVNGECCYCRTHFTYRISLKDDLFLILKCFVPKVIIGVLKYIILLYFTFCLIIHGTSFINEIMNIQNVITSLLNCISFMLFIGNQILVFNSVEVLFNEDTNWICKIPSYCLLYIISIALLYSNMKLILI